MKSPELSPVEELPEHLGSPSHWDKAYKIYEINENRGLTYFLIGMSPEKNLLEKDPDAYREGLNFVIQASQVNDWTVRYQAVNILANTLIQTRENPQHEKAYAAAANAIQEIIENDERIELRLFAKQTRKKYFRKN